MANRSLSEQLLDATVRCESMDAPLEARLQSFADAVREASPEFASVVDRMVARLAASGVGADAPKPGDEMPDFLLPDQNGVLVSLSELLARGPTVIAFHRGHWCPYCHINARALGNMGRELLGYETTLVAITPETAEFSAQLGGYDSSPYPVLTDIDNGYALELGIAFWVGAEKSSAMKAEGWDISPYQGNEAWTLPIPATFVVGTNGRVVARFVDPDYRKRMALEDILAAVQRSTQEA